MKRPTMADVARHANVSKSTVSQYLNKRYHYMGEETKLRIEKAIQTLGYEANVLARSLKQKKTSTIGVIVANILHVFSTQIIRAIEDVCHEHDFHVIVCNADDDPAKEKKYIQMLRAKQVDGFIVFPTGENKALYEDLLQEDYPLIFIDRIVEEVVVDAFLLDNHAAVQLAVDHFLSKGHERIGIITTSLIHHVTPRVERMVAFGEVLKQQAIKSREAYQKGLEIQEIKHGLMAMLALEEPPTAILAGNDLALIEILKAVKEYKLRIPEDFALIGIDDIPFAGLFDPPLTTIAQPTFRMGKEAADLLIHKINGMEDLKSSQIHRFPPRLIQRASC